MDTGDREKSENVSDLSPLNKRWPQGYHEDIENQWNKKKSYEIKMRKIRLFLIKKIRLEPDK